MSDMHVGLDMSCRQCSHLQCPLSLFAPFSKQHCAPSTEAIASMTGKVIIQVAHLRDALHDAHLQAALLFLDHSDGVLVGVVYIIYHG